MSDLRGTGLLLSLASVTAVAAAGRTKPSLPPAGGPTPTLPALGSKGAASAASPFFSLGAALEIVITQRTQTCNNYKLDALNFETNSGESEGLSGKICPSVALVLNPDLCRIIRKSDCLASDSLQLQWQNNLPFCSNLCVYKITSWECHHILS